MPTSTPCKACGRRVGRRGITLYAGPQGPVMVCNRRCLAAYEGPESEPCDCPAHAGRVQKPKSRTRRGGVKCRTIEPISLA